MSDHIGFLFFFNDTATTEIYTLSLHDALPIYPVQKQVFAFMPWILMFLMAPFAAGLQLYWTVNNIISIAQQKLLRSEEHTSELQSRQYLVCRLLLEKKKNYTTSPAHTHDAIRS